MAAQLAVLDVDGFVVDQQPDRASGTTPSTNRPTAQTVELDLATVAPSIAGPKRPRTHPVDGRPTRGWLLAGGQPAIGRPVRIDTPAEAGYYRHGGILQYLLRQLLEQ